MFCGCGWSLQELSRQAVVTLGLEYADAHKDELETETHYVEHLEAESYANRMNLPSLLPFPFTARPTVGERHSTIRFLSRLLPTIAQELNDWKNKPRYRALCLLRTMIVYGK